MTHPVLVSFPFPIPFLLAFALVARPARSQERTVESGTKVRVSTSGSGTVEGRLQELTSDALLIELARDSRVETVPLSEVTKLETSLGSRGRGSAAWSKAKWGALIGAIPGAISLGAQHQQVGEDGSSVAGAAALGAWSGAILGGLIGAAVGAIHPGEEWQKVVPSFRVVTSGRDRGARFSLTLAF
jgi:hypothetical protein